MLRTILGMLVGIAVAAGVLYAAQYGYAHLYPPPGAVGPATPEVLFAFAINAHIVDLTKFTFAAPPDAVACLIGGWALSALLGGWFAAAIARPHRGAAATAIGALVTVVVLVFATFVPNPAWFAVVGMLLPMPFALLAGRVAMPSREF